MSKKNCKKGYSCGRSCIAVSRACRKEFPNNVSVSLDKKTVIDNSKVESWDAEEVVSSKFKPSKNTRMQVFGEGDKKLAISEAGKDSPVLGGLEGYPYMYEKEELKASGWNKLNSSWNGSVKDISDAREKPDKSTWEKEILPRLEEGDLVSHMPTSKENAGAYEGLGFGKVQEGSDGFDESFQFAIFSGGKLVPIELAPDHSEY